MLKTIYKLHKNEYGEPVHVADKEKFVNEWINDNRVGQYCETDEEFEKIRQEMLDEFVEIDIQNATAEELIQFFDNEYWYSDLEQIEAGLGEYVKNKINAE